jgi:hypothetical protein
LLIPAEQILQEYFEKTHMPENSGFSKYSDRPFLASPQRKIPRIYYPEEDHF